MGFGELEKNFDFMNTKRYKSDVLIGNWFEERFSSLIDRRAIVPTISGNTVCMQDPSVYKTSYQRPPRGTTSELYRTNKVEGFSNQLKSRQDSLKLFDGAKFLNNFATTSDVSYRILPEQARNRKRSENVMDFSRATNDLLDIYGNATNFGLRQCKRLQQRVESVRFRSYYNEVYTPKLQLLQKTEKQPTCRPKNHLKRKLYA